MLKTIYDWLLGIEHDVESLVAPLTDMVKRLEEHAEQKSAEILKHIDVVQSAQRLADVASDEATKARNAAEKIGALVR